MYKFGEIVAKLVTFGIVVTTKERNNDFNYQEN